MLKSSALPDENPDPLSSSSGSPSPLPLSFVCDLVVVLNKSSPLLLDLNVDTISSSGQLLLLLIVLILSFVCNSVVVLKSSPLSDENPDPLSSSSGSPSPLPLSFLCDLVVVLESSPIPDPMSPSDGSASPLSPLPSSFGMSFNIVSSLDDLIFLSTTLLSLPTTLS